MDGVLGRYWQFDSVLDSVKDLLIDFELLNNLACLFPYLWSVWIMPFRS